MLAQLVCSGPLELLLLKLKPSGSEGDQAEEVAADKPAGRPSAGVRKGDGARRRREGGEGGEGEQGQRQPLSFKGWYVVHTLGRPPGGGEGAAGGAEAAGAGVWMEGLEQFAARLVGLQAPVSARARRGGTACRRCGALATPAPCDALRHCKRHCSARYSK